MQLVRHGDEHVSGNRYYNNCHVGSTTDASNPSYYIVSCWKFACDTIRLKVRTLSACRETPCTILQFLCSMNSENLWPTYTSVTSTYNAYSSHDIMECTPKKNPHRWKAEAVVFCTAPFKQQSRLRLELRLLNPLGFVCEAMYVFCIFPQGVLTPPPSRNRVSDGPIRSRRLVSFASCSSSPAQL
ncbi:unnamed protein product [Ectocarpus fasciculatus]